MQSLKQSVVSKQACRSMAPPRAALSTRTPASLKHMISPSVAPISRTRVALQTRRMASAIASQAAGVVASAGTEKTANPMPIVFVSAECAPWSKTGGLGDVVGGLPIELAKRGHKVITVSPRYDQYSDAWDTSVVVNIDGEDVRFFHSVKKGVHRVWVDHPWFLAKVWGKTGSKLYGPASGADYVDNHKRFTLFCKAAIESTRALPFGFGEDCVFVANDWHSAMVPVLLKDVYQPQGQFTKSKVALCIHNIAFQGRMWEDSFKDMGLPESSFEKLAFTDGLGKVYDERTPMAEDEVKPLTGRTYKKINWLKAGILACDQVVTVSPNYAEEISADEAGGVELDSVIRAKGGAVGIVNGMDVEEWDPRADKYLTIKFDKNTVFEGKAAAKEALQADVGLPVDPSAPLFCFIGRLEEQKGVDILLEAVPSILAQAPNAQVVILGTGKAKFEKQLAAVDKAFKGRARGVVKFSAPLAHLMTGGADYILVPSRFEPCGLIQLHAMQYGTIPIVASTGGLVDTVKEGVTGFHMGSLDKDTLVQADVEALAATCARAAQVFPTAQHKEMVYNCISQDLSWSKPAIKWEGVLEALRAGTPVQGSVKATTIKVPVAEPIPGPVAATDKPLTRPVPPPAPKTVSSYSAAAPSAASSSTATTGLNSSATPTTAAAPAAATRTVTPTPTPIAPISTPAAVTAAPAVTKAAATATVAPAASKPAAPAAAAPAATVGAGAATATATPVATKA